MNMKARLSLNLPTLPPIAKAESSPLPPIKATREIQDYHNESDIHEDILIKFNLPGGELIEQKVIIILINKTYQQNYHFILIIMQHIYHRFIHKNK